MKRLRCENLASRVEDYLPHVFAAHAKAPTSQTRDDFVAALAVALAGVCHLAKSYDARSFVACRAVILGEFGLDDDAGLEFVGDNEVRCLIKTSDSFGSFGFAKADAGASELFFNRCFQSIANQFADRIPVTREQALNNSVREQHC